MAFPSIIGLLRLALLLLLPASALLTTYFYLYPVFVGGCSFPQPIDGGPGHGTDEATAVAASRAAFRQALGLHVPPALARLIGADPAGVTAPFRLLALGDPQLEGDTSIPNAHKEHSFPHLVSLWGLLSFRDGGLSLPERWLRIQQDAAGFWLQDVPDTATSLRKRLDHVGNDYYLAHIYRTLQWWAAPTHVAVLGDLVGSQWISDDEFAERGRRYWQRVFAGSERVPDELAAYPTSEYKLSGQLSRQPGHQTEWARRIVNVAGNHDIGYAGDLTEERVARFERVFGKANYELRFELPLAELSAEAAAALGADGGRLVPQLRLVNLNDMNLDTPAISEPLQDQTYSFLNAVIDASADVAADGHFTIVLTHVPLHKAAGTCVDAPYFSFTEPDDDPFGLGDIYLREQNQLSTDASRGFLEGIFGMHRDPAAPAGGRGRRGVILNGHDHEGCDVLHYVNQSAPADDEAAAAWQAVRWPAAENLVGRPGLPGIREITLRSMMGDYGGNAGLLSAWFDEAAWQWRFELSMCAVGRHHIWWVVHVVDLIAAGVLLAYVLAVAVESITKTTKTATARPTVTAAIAATAATTAAKTAAATAAKTAATIAATPAVAKSG